MRRHAASRRWFLRIYTVATLAVVLASFPLLAHGQSGPGHGYGLCGFDKVATPGSSTITAGAAFQQLSVSTTAVSPTVPTLAQGNIVGAKVQVLIGFVNVRHDGTAPTANVGTTWGPGGVSSATFSNGVIYDVCGTDLQKIQFIRAGTSATGSILNIQYYTVGG